MKTFHWGKWVDSDTPVTGVVSCNSVEWLYEEVDYGDSIDLSYEEAWQEYRQEQINQWELDHGESFSEVDNPDWLEEDWRETFNNFYDGSDTFLIGSWRQDDNGQYDVDKSGEYSAIVRYDSNVVQVVRSRTTSRGRLCSPCYPGQVDLDSLDEDGYLAYDLPSDLYGSFRNS